jgi:hypothetical protein
LEDWFDITEAKKVLEQEREDDLLPWKEVLAGNEYRVTFEG